MRTRGWRALLIAVWLSTPACETPPAPLVQKPAATRWHSLGEWSGRGNRQTESFDVITGALRLRWQTRNGRVPGAGAFRVSLHSAISGRPLQMFVEHDGTGAGTAYVEDDPRVSYLVIESASVEWTVALEEAVSAGSPTVPR